jgi:hypothetical protein
MEKTPLVAVVPHQLIPKVMRQRSFRFYNPFSARYDYRARVTQLYNDKEKIQCRISW